MNQIVKRAVLFCGTGGILLAGWQAIPLMQSVEIGAGAAQQTVQPEVIQNEESAAESPAESQITQSGTYIVPEVQAPAALPADDSNLINVE